MDRKLISDEAVKRATGKTRAEWFAIIDKAGGAKMTHKEIARMLYGKHHVSGWWCQMVTVEYEYAKGRRIVGETADAGFEIGVQKSFPVSASQAWNVVTGPGLKLWLVDASSIRLEKGASYETSDGTTGEIRSYEPGKKLRLTWKPKGWENPSTLQIYVLPTKKTTSIHFHQERLSGIKEREAMRKHWQEALNRLGSLFA